MFLMMEPESDVGKLVRRARIAQNMSQSALAKEVGTEQQTIEKIERGKIKHSSYMHAIARRLDIAIDKVVRNPKPKAALLKTVPTSQLVGERDLPVYAAVQGGVGVAILSSDPVEYVARPDPLARVTGGYGVIVIEDSMAPEFRSGDTALVNPHLAARAGHTCIFRHEAQDGTQTARIKFLRRATETLWHVTEWNDGHPKEFTLKRSEWQTAHVVVAGYKRH